MLRKMLVMGSLLMMPLITFAQASENAGGHGNGNAFGLGNGNAYGRVTHAPEIDSSNIVLGITLFGGIVSLIVRRRKK
jgi:hypothetical protein